MKGVRKAWTDERLDDLAQKVDLGFARVDSDLREIRGQMGSVQRTMLGLFGTMVIGFVSVLGGIVATQL
jgi:hypothetical protein